MRPATQASIAVSGNGTEWIVVGASPDLRQQILQTPSLWPRAGSRHSPIAAVVLIGGDVDALAGLLVLRERQAFTVYAPRPMLDLLDENRIFDVLDPTVVRRETLVPLEPVPCGGGLVLTLLAMPERFRSILRTAAQAQPEPGPNYAALLEANGRSVIIAPACAEITAAVRRQLARCRSGVLRRHAVHRRRDDRGGAGQKTGRRMGHVPVSGPGGTLEGLADLPGRRILLHINNSNPILLRLDSPERRQVEAAGFEVAYDGMEVRL